MATQIATAELPVIKAAGGIVLRKTPRGEEALIVFRKRYQDFTLPKGKLQSQESFQEAALREVEEETGCRCHLASYLGTISYPHNGVPKVVMFWKMSVVAEKPCPAENEEISEALWLPLAAAVQRLTHAQERSLLAKISAARRGPVPVAPQATPPQPREISAPERQSALTTIPTPVLPHAAPPEIAEDKPQPAPALVESSISPQAAPQRGVPVSAMLQSAPAMVVTPIASLRTAWAGTRIFSRANSTPTLADLWTRKRRAAKSKRAQVLQHEMEAVQVEVAFLECRDGILDITWASAARECLQNAKQCLKNNDVAGGWAALRSAQRYSILGLKPPELAARGQVLREQARKMSSWRRDAIQKLLATSDDHLTAPRIIDAVALRDEEEAEQKQQARTLMSRMHLMMALCLLGMLAMLASLATSGLYYDFAPLGFLGLLGSALSAAQALIRGKNERTIPGRIMTLVMVTGGAIAGFAADAIYKDLAHYFKLGHDYDFAIYLLAFIFGYAGQKVLYRLAGYSYIPERAIYY